MNNLKQCKNAKRSTRNRHTGVINAHKARILETGDPVKDTKGKAYTIMREGVVYIEGQRCVYDHSIVRGRGV